jgi:lysophospholipase L1-like esterase
MMNTGKCAMRLLVLFALLVAHSSPASQPPDNAHTLSILGSSVAKGWKGAGFSQNQFTNGSVQCSYAGDLTELAAANGWRVTNQSIPGDTTPKVIRRFDRDEIPVRADADIIGLSLGNEGLQGAKNPAAICGQFYRGITNLMAMSRAHGIRPVIGNNYPKDGYSPDEYARLKQVNLQLNALDAPSINFLGATDDGQGHWVKNSFINLGAGDGIHPNGAGHYEMFLAIVPSVFDALLAGKPTPHWGDRDRFLRITGNAAQRDPLTFHPSLIMHSFTMAFRVRTSGTGTVAAAEFPNSLTHSAVIITPSGLAYLGAYGTTNNTDVACNDGHWHEIVVTHQYARGLTWIYVDGVLKTTVAERLTPTGFILGGPGADITRSGSPTTADYQDWFVYRSMLNAEDVAAQFHGHLQQASLELYAPLDDEAFAPGKAVRNLAQSLSEATVLGASANFHSVKSSSSLN